MAQPLLEVRDLRTHFELEDGVVKAVDGVSLTVRRGRTLAVVGESGCGKSVTARSILRLVEHPARIVGGQILLYGDQPSDDPLDLLAAKDKRLRQVRWSEIAMVFQEPMASLSLVHTIGDQIIEAIRLHGGVGKVEARHRAIEFLGRVGIPDPKRRVDSYPFELSGGMRQRAMIAMALSCRPRLLIADEPTTALDVTTQAQILDLLQDLQQELGMAIMLITHDLGVAAQVADEVAVMYLGEVVEHGPAASVLSEPKHPYTQALVRSVPRLGQRGQGRLAAVRGTVPPPYERPSGCRFHPRCDAFMAGKCDSTVPTRVRSDDTDVACLLYGEEER
ncbi:peptide/nickel transport system ATP-binding protein [Kribbella sp. VKM Ac-2527]|uniref:Peptide/nickel transport system ATP-binding protein n=1 Tax=Kribbella caucasensis TaxID=2512215 RepID=A0A4R6KMH3_9ACTN|nr:ABC transporter ATP-binding protein [Kribbella sp. VKM Ac-2527]TDO52451.1 peptide/nickel transport system ATP-binding protein [Kribbella sp. VKM Ac-2527]